MTLLAIEAATDHVEVRVENGTGTSLAHRVEAIGHGHTRRLTPLVRAALDESRQSPSDLKHIAADLGPGSFTGVRVGLATANALAMVSGATLVGATSLAALAHGLRGSVKRTLIVPLVGAGRRDVYAGFFRTDSHGETRLLAAPCVGPTAVILDRVAELKAAIGPAMGVLFIGPGAAREREALEDAWPGSTRLDFRATGLSAEDLAYAARLQGGAPLGLPEPGVAPEPVYVRHAQAEERVRHRALAGIPIMLRDMRDSDVPAIAAIEQRVFPDPWPESSFASELRQPAVYSRVAERQGQIAGYCLTWFGSDFGHLGNLAAAPDQQRRGVGAALVDDVLERARVLRVRSITLEVRVSNAAAQELYRRRGFRVAAARRRYYRDNGEDALVMEWRSARK